MRGGHILATLIGALIGLTVFLVGCSQPAPAAAPATAAPQSAAAQASGKVEYPTMSLKLGHPLAKTHIYSQAVDHFAKSMSNLSGGKVTVEIFDSGSLVKGDNELTSLSTNVVDFGSVIPPYHSGELPFLDEVSLHMFMYSRKGIPLLFQRLKPQIEQDLAAQRIKLILYNRYTMGFFLRNAIDPKNPSFSGMKLSSPGGSTTRIIQFFGGSTVNMPSPEIPVALRTGVMQGMSTSLSSWDALGIANDAPYVYYSMSDTVSWGTLLGMNSDRYAKLPSSVQQLIDKAAAETEQWAAGNVDEVETAIIKKAQANPQAKVHELTTEEVGIWRTKLQPLFEDIGKRYGDKGVNFLKLADQVRAETSK